jgi:hypothetical protein
MYSHQGKRASVKRPGIFYHAKITTVDPTHTCGMCPRDMQIAAQRMGHLVVNLAGMKDILSLLSAKSCVACQVLRPMVENYVCWTGFLPNTSPTFINEFFCFLSRTQIMSI